MPDFQGPLSQEEINRIKRDAPASIVLSAKLQSWAKIKGIQFANAKSIRDMYENEKKVFGLASISRIQLEVENALIVATNGKYKRTINPNGTARLEPMQAKQS